MINHQSPQLAHLGVRCLLTHLVQLVELLLGTLQFLEGLLSPHLELVDVLLEFALFEVGLGSLLHVVVLDSVERLLVEAQLLSEEATLVGLRLEDAAEEGEGIGFKSFVALAVEVGEGLFVGSAGLPIDDGIVLFCDFEDGADQVLINHAIDLVIDVIHYLI